MHISRSNAPGLIKLLLHLPNLDTLEVFTGDYKESTIKRSFKSTKLPQIRTLVIDAPAHHLMKCCINVKRVIIHWRGFDVTYLESIPFVANSLVYLALCLPGPENIQGVDVFSSSLSKRFKRMVRAGPAMSQSRGIGHCPGRSSLSNIRNALRAYSNPI